jgi:hypothetical protein
VIVSLVSLLARRLVELLVLCARTDASTDVELLVFCHGLSVLRPPGHRSRPRRADRAFWSLWPRFRLARARYRVLRNRRAKVSNLPC